MLAELVDHVIGVDPDRDWITAAIIDANTTGVVATERFAADLAATDSTPHAHTTGIEKRCVCTP